MKGYRAAKSRADLKKVKEVKYDKYFFNFEDPKILRKMTTGKHREQIWKRTFGFDFVSFLDKKDPVKYSKCAEYCFKEEYKGFADKCKKKGGLFKCCQIQ